jgi:hypothetical protein
LSDGGQSASTERSPAILRNPNLDPVQRLSEISVFLLAHNEEGNVELVVERFKAELPKLTKGAMITTELMAKLTGRGSRITEAGVQNGNSLRVIVRAFKELFGLYWKLRAAQRSSRAKTRLTSQRRCQPHQLGH